MNKKAFTLLELLVVVLIVGILAAIALPQYKFAVRKTEFTKLQPMVKTLLEAQNRYFLTNGNFATKLEYLDIDLPIVEINPAGYSSILTNGEICSVNSNGEVIFCATKDQMNSYLTFPINAQNAYYWGRGKRYCVASSVDTDDKYNKFCQKLTKTSSPSRETNIYMYYRFYSSNLYEF